MSGTYGFRFEHRPGGVRFVKQLSGEELPHGQSERTYPTWQEARDAGLAWEQAANDPRILTVCSPMYQERRLDGVMAHLEYDPEGGTLLVEDTACRDRYELDRNALVADAAAASEQFRDDELEAYAASLRKGQATR